ncbi:MAG TPA: hypothetical protein DCF33_09380 [Saprospirales bacterium]|nr:hypothetical protein [Saprospirales bacterium]
MNPLLKSSIVALLLGLCSSQTGLMAQQPGFSRVYEMNAPSAGFHNLIVIEDTLYVAGTAISDNIQQWGILLSKFDTLGNLLSQYTVYDTTGDDYIFEPNYDIIETLDGNLAITGNLWYKNWGFMAKFTKSGKLLFLKEYQEPGILNFRYASIVQIPDGYLIAGSKQLGNYRSVVFIQKVSPEGDVVWEKKYGNQQNDNHLSTIEKVGVDKFIVGASEASHFAPPPYVIGQDWARNWIFIIDSIGNIVQEYKSAKYEESGSPGIHRTEDNGYIYATGNLQILNPYTFGWRIKVVKRDSNFNLVWSRFLSPIPAPGNTIYELKPTPDGNWVALGQWTTLDGTAYGWPAPCLYALTSNGDSLWSRCDTVVGNNFGGDELGGLAVLPSGSTVAAGKVYHGNDIGIRALGWLYKVDNKGCLDTLCNSITDVKTPRFPDSGFDIYPNPTDRQINIRTLDPLPFSLTCYDALGRVIFDKRQVLYKCEVDLSLQKPGLYFVSINMGEKILIEKVVKW